MLPRIRPGGKKNLNAFHPRDRDAESQRDHGRFFPLGDCSAVGSVRQCAALNREGEQSKGIGPGGGGTARPKQSERNRPMFRNNHRDPDEARQEDDERFFPLDQSAGGGAGQGDQGGGDSDPGAPDPNEATVRRGTSWDDVCQDGRCIRMYHAPGTPADPFIDAPPDDSPQRFWRQFYPRSIYALGSMKVLRSVSMWKHVSPGKRNLLRALYWYANANDDHACHASRETLAAASALSVRTARRYLKELEADHMFLSVEGRTGYTTRYKMAGAMNSREFSAALKVQAATDAALAGGGGKPQARWQPMHRGEEAAVDRWGYDRLPWLIAARDDMTAAHVEAWLIIDRATFNNPAVGYTEGLQALAARLQVCQRWAEKIRAYLVKIGRVERVSNGPGRRKGYRTVKAVTPADVRCCEGFVRANGGRIDSEDWVWMEQRHPRLNGATPPRPNGATPPVVTAPRSVHISEQRLSEQEAGGKTAGCPPPTPSRQEVLETIARMQREVGQISDDLRPNRIDQVKRQQLASIRAGERPGPERGPAAATPRKPITSRAWLRSEIVNARTKADMVRALRRAGIKTRQAQELVEQHGLDRIREVAQMIPDTARKSDGADNIAGFIVRALKRGDKPGRKGTR